jgi:hypothetical protein
MDPAGDFAYFISYICPYVNQLTGIPRGTGRHLVVLHRIHLLYPDK